MKKIAFIILCLIISINYVKAECQDTEILKWAKDVEVCSSMDNRDKDYCKYQLKGD